jgi:ABC-type uncharacterized transport system involved in gliding motility auxiliary subunit
MKAKLPKLPFDWKTLFWLGPLLIVFGLSVGVVSGKWEPLPLILLIAGATFLGLAVLYQIYTAKGFWGRRSTEMGSNALVSTLAVLLILVIVNFVAIRYAGRLDLTENQVLSLAPQSQQQVSKLNQPVKLLIFTITPAQVNSVVLDQYKQASGGKFTYQIINPEADPLMAERYKIQRNGDMVLEMGQRTQSLPGPLTEMSLTPAIARLLSNQQASAYFTSGHGERSLAQGEGAFSQAATALQNQNITPKPLNLLTEGQVPATANVVVIAGPRKPFLPNEVQVLDAYLNAGGKALLLLDPQTETGLDSLLKSWGVRLDSKRVVIDNSRRVAQLGPQIPVITQYGDHPITSSFQGQPSIFPLAQAVTATPIGNEKIVELLKTTEKSWAEADLKNPEVQLNPETDQKGPLSLGVAISRTLQVTPGQPPKEARLIVIGNSEFAADTSLGFGAGLNGDVFVNSVTWLSDIKEIPLSISPKDPKNRRLEPSADTSRWIFFTSIGLFPFGAFFMAVFTWWRRR